MRLLLVADRRAPRVLWKRRVRRCAQAECVVVATSRAAPFVRREHAPDVVLLCMDDVERSFAAFDAIRREAPRIPVVLLEAPADELALQQAIDRGASGYVLWDDEPALVLVAAGLASRGVAFFSPRSLARMALDDGGLTVREPSRSVDRLSCRELETLCRIARGDSKKEIARELHLSVRTVNKHVENLMGKLEIHDRVHLARFAIREGLVQA